MTMNLKLNSRYSNVTYGEFHLVMLSLGFSFSRTRNGFRRYYHADSDTEVVVSAGEDDELIPTLYITGHGRVLDLRGIVEEDRFREMLASQKVA
jgi:hypothetical protein